MRLIRIHAKPDEIRSSHNVRHWDAQSNAIVNWDSYVFLLIYKQDTREIHVVFIWARILQC